MKEIQCRYKADLRYTWPGNNEAFVCIKCVNMVRTTAKVMGFHLDIIRVDTKKQCEYMVIDKTK